MAGLVTIYLPLCDGMGYQMSFGIAEELLKLSVKHGAQARYPEAWLENGTHEERAQQRYQVQFNPWLFAPEAEKLLLEAGAEIMFDTLICSAEVENGSKLHISETLSE